jgi:hypothetical protein
MILKWNLFAASAILAAYFLISRGIPVVPVLAGCGLAALVTWRKLSRSAAKVR